MLATRTYGFSASVELSVRFHFDRTIHGKTLSRPVDSLVAFGARTTAFQ